MLFLLFGFSILFFLLFTTKTMDVISFLEVCKSLSTSSVQEEERKCVILLLHQSYNARLPNELICTVKPTSFFLQYTEANRVTLKEWRKKSFPISVLNLWRVWIKYGVEFSYEIILCSFSLCHCFPLSSCWCVQNSDHCGVYIRVHRCSLCFGDCFARVTAVCIYWSLGQIEQIGTYISISIR